MTNITDGKHTRQNKATNLMPKWEGSRVNPHHRSYYQRLVVLLFRTYTERIITNINYYDLVVSTVL